MRSSSKKSGKNQAIVPKIPRGMRSLPVVTSPSDMQSDMRNLQADAAQIEEWWGSQRWRLTKRVYSGTNMGCEVFLFGIPFL